MSYNVFTDFHHASLLQSLILLFEKRLGGSVYRPIGETWYNNGFWKVYDHPATAKQFLGLNAATPDGSHRLNDWIGTGPTPGKTFGPPTSVFYCKDIDSGQTNSAITFEGFMEAPIDIVIASLPQHVEPFKKLCELHPNKPKLIYQIGNQWDITPGIVSNVMASAKITNPPAVNFIQYHQEFDTEIFKPGWPIGFAKEDKALNGIEPEKVISSFVNVFNGQEHFKDDYQLFLAVENGMLDWRFRSHGGQCRDGAIGPSDKLAQTMRQSRFIWHTKRGGDGYGHIVHNAFAVGRPLIVKKEYYQGRLAEDLMIDGETCITIDGLSPEEIVKKILYFNDPFRYGKLCQFAYDRFTKVVDFDAEFIQLQKFLANLV
jgi:hypothetical protein